MAIQTKVEVSLCPFFNQEDNYCIPVHGNPSYCALNGQGWRSCPGLFDQLTELDADARAKKHRDECLKVGEMLEDCWKHQRCGAEDWSG